MNIGRENIILRLFLSIFALFCVMQTSLAANHSLIGIDVRQNNKSVYNVVLKLEGKTHIKKSINSNNSLSLILNSTVPSEDIQIVYDNASNINNVVVQKKNADNTIVVIEGKDIANANIYTKDTLTGFLTPVIGESFFFGFNKQFFKIAVVFMFIMFFVIVFSKPKRKNNKEMLKKQISISHTTPSIGYNSTKGYVSVPKGFVINHYMENEKIKKAS